MKAIYYSIAAVIVGLALVWVPLVTFGEIKSQNYAGLNRLFPEQLEELQEPHSNAKDYSESDVEVLSVWFMVALGAYLLLKSKMSKYENAKLWPYLY